VTRAFLVALVSGEASGDAHGAELMAAIRRLDPGARLHGAGGPKMAALAEPGILEWTGRLDGS